MAVDQDIVVIGAGISGLATAFWLNKFGLGVEVIETALRPGGVIGSERRDGLLYERGPNSTLDTSPLINTMLGDLGILGERVDTSAVAAKRFIVRSGRLVALPASPPALLRTQLFSLRAKLRLLREPFINPASADIEESVAQFVTRRLGLEFLDYAIEPFVAGVYAGDPAQLSLPAAFPRLRTLEQHYGSLIKGQILGARERAKQAEQSRNVATSFSFRDGMQTLTDALSRAAGHVATGVRAIELQRVSDGTIAVVVERASTAAVRRARSVVLAVPADHAAMLVRDIAPDAARALEEIPYAGIASVASAYRRSDVGHPLDGFGFLAPKVENRRILGSLFSSSMFDNRSPDGMVLLTTFVGGARDPHLPSLPEGDLATIVSEELSALIGARAGPRFCAVTRWPRAIPQYTLGHLDRIRRAEGAQTALPGLFLCASYSGGVSVSDCIKSGHRIARTVADYLGRSTD